MVILGILGTQEIIFILIIVLILFGAKKIPELMKGLGRGVKEFKDGMNGIEGKNEVKNEDPKNPSEPKTESPS
ncbi:MAG: twin-arginine translocase TatA/TatE family subunit [Bacteroidales bacterium]|nr:twin-arginine translocase TatA/TatE family subunit [Bacteroidales bacterium]